MIITKGLEHTFRIPFGSRWAGKLAFLEYQVLNKDLTVREPYTSTGLLEIGDGDYGLTRSFSIVFPGFLRFKITTGDNPIQAIPVTVVVKEYSGMERTFIFHFGIRRTGKTVQYRLIDKILTPITSWSGTGVVELGDGQYGIATLAITNPFNGFLEGKEVEDNFFIAIPVTFRLKEYLAIAYKLNINIPILTVKLGTTRITL